MNALFVLYRKGFYFSLGLFVIDHIEESAVLDNGKTAAWETLLPWLKLYFTPSLGPVRIARLVEHFGSAKAVFTTRTALLRQSLPANIVDALSGIDSNNGIQKKMNAVRDWLNATDHHYVLCPDSDHYPAVLRQLPDYPPILFASGNIKLLQTPMLAIVGSRRPTAQGNMMAEKIAFELAQYGLTIVSGLAAGIDTRAHRGGLSATKSSVAVIGTGIDKVYPAINQSLSCQMEAEGLLVSEFPLGTPPAASNFPKRNRIISGLALGVLVVEAAEKSGSLITARLALEQGREVFAMPGAINNYQTKGCHWLIREGAVLVWEASQILEELKLPLKQWITNDNSIKPASAELSEENQIDIAIKQVACPVQRNLLQSMGSESWHMDELLLNMSVSQEELITALVLLEINGMVMLDSCGYRRILG